MVLFVPAPPLPPRSRAILRWIRDTVLPDPGIGFNLARMLHPEMGPMLVSMLVILDGRPREAAESALAPLRALGPVQVGWGWCICAALAALRGHPRFGPGRGLGRQPLSTRAPSVNSLQCCPAELAAAPRPGLACA